MGKKMLKPEKEERKKGKCILNNFINEVKKDLFSVSEEYYLAHCISADFGMGKGIVVEFNKRFDMKIFISGFFGNAILAILLTVLGQKLNVDIYLAAIVVFVGRM